LYIFELLISHHPSTSPFTRDSLLEEFGEEILMRWQEKIEILTSTHFVFELKSEMRVDEIVLGFDSQKPF